MAQAKGSKGKVIIDTETTFKSTRAVTAAHVLPITSESLRLSRNLIDSKTLRGNRNPYTPVRGQYEVAGDLNVELSPYMGRMFYHALGTVSTTGSNPYSHTFTINDLPTGLTIEKQFTDITKYHKYNGCKVNSFRMSFKPEGYIETTFGIMGAAETLTTTSFDGNATDYTSGSYGGPFDAFECTVTDSAGASLGNVTALDITLENNLDGSVFVIDGTGQRYSLPEGTVKISGTLTALFEDETLYGKAVNNTESSIKVVLSHGTGAGSAYNEKMEIYIDELYFSPNAPVIPGPQGILVELPFTGFYNNGTYSPNSAFRIVLGNTQTQGVIFT